MEIRFVNTRYGTVEVSIKGEGLPLLILHGAHSDCRDELIARGIDTAQYHIILPSRPGYGKTKTIRQLSPEETVDMFAEMMYLIGAKQYIVCGVSAGGPAAIALSAAYPDRVLKLLLVSAVTKPWLEHTGVKRKLAIALFHPMVEWCTWGMVRMFSYMFPVLAARLFFIQFSTHSRKKMVLRDVVLLNRSLRKYRSGKGFIYDIRFSETSIAAEEVRCPTLILHSYYDRSVDISHAVHLRERIPQSELRIFKNYWGHLLWLGSGSERFMQVVNHFLTNYPDDRD